MRFGAGLIHRRCCRNQKQARSREWLLVRLVRELLRLVTLLGWLSAKKRVVVERSPLGSPRMS